VTDREMAAACRLAAERAKLVVEPAAGCALAAALRLATAAGGAYADARRIGVILCGGNVDMDALPWTLPSFAKDSPEDIFPNRN